VPFSSFAAVYFAQRIAHEDEHRTQVSHADSAHGEALTIVSRNSRNLTSQAAYNALDAASTGPLAHPTAVSRSSFSLKSLSYASLILLLLSATGCTIGAIPGTPTLANTTSAEQTQRIFWQDVKQEKWQPVQGILTANVTWRNGPHVLTRDEVVPYLQKQQVKDFLITNMVVKANQDDMTLLYDLQLTTAASAQPVNFHVVSVWQRVPPPPDNASKQEKKQAKQAAKAGPYMLIVEDLVPDTPTQ
jgi:hypothetical protein